MTEVPPAKKRRWRKPASPVKASSEDYEQKCIKPASGSGLGNFLHPEVFTHEQLTYALHDYHVPFGANCSRDELVELFSKHVMPKPQRQKRSDTSNNRSRSEVEVHSSAASCNDGQQLLEQQPANGSNAEDDRIVNKRKNTTYPTVPHQKKAFIRSDITWP